MPRAETAVGEAKETTLCIIVALWDVEEEIYPVPSNVRRCRRRCCYKGKSKKGIGAGPRRRSVEIETERGKTAVAMRTSCGGCAIGDEGEWSRVDQSREERSRKE